LTVAASEKKVWAGIGLALILFLIVTTPGWKDVLGIGTLPNFGALAPALLLLGFMGALLLFVLIGGKESPPK
jgi:hypothetical protein